MSDEVLEEVTLTEPEERILGETARQMQKAAEDAAAGRVAEKDAMYVAGQAMGAYEAVLQLRGLNPREHRATLDDSGRMRLFKVSARADTS